MSDPINIDPPQGELQNGAPPAAQGEHQPAQAAAEGNDGQASVGSNHPGAPESPVKVSVHGGDEGVLIVVIDRTATQNKIIEELGLELAKFGVPYRPVDQRIFEAVQVKVREGISYQEASVRVFGNPHMAERIRYWLNNWSRQ